MTVQPRPELRAVRAVVHGAVLPAEVLAAGLAPEEVLDFSVSTNPLGPPPGALEAVRGLSAGAAGRYPDPTARALRRALGERLGLDPEEVVVGNGSVDLIWSLALAFARPAPAGVLVCAPTFGEYERASRLLGATVSFAQAAPEEDFRLDFAAAAEHIRCAQPALVWLCNPNNPTGRYASRGDVEALLDACLSAGSLLAVDEAYLPFVDGAASLLGLLPSGHLVLLRSLTKDYALAGLRLGYALAAEEVVAALRLVQPPWSVSAPAQAAGVAALADPGHLERARGEVRAARALLVAGLEDLGLRVVPPAANFVLCEVGDAPGFRARLLGRGCVVRDCTSFGLPCHVRIGVRTRAECARLVAAIRDVVEETS